MLENFKNMGKTLKQAKQMKEMMEDVQKELKTTVIPVTALNGKITIEITGELEVTKVEIDPSLLGPDQKETLQTELKKAFTQAISKAKDIATNKLQSVTGGLFSQ